MTTVGYGDQFPVSDQGRMVAAALMLCGIALIGTVTATLASYLVEAVRDDREAVSERAQILAEIAALRRDLAALAPGGNTCPGCERARRPPFVTCVRSCRCQGTLMPMCVRAQSATLR